MASVSRNQKKALLGKKLGMTQVFREDGAVVPVTVIEAGPCAVLQVRTEETDGYSAYQVGFDDRRKANRPDKGRFDKAGVGPKGFIREIPFIDPADVDGAGEDGAGGPEIRPGSVIKVSMFASTPRVDVQGISKGRGFAGVIKRHGFQRGDASHGSKNVREPGSTGQHTDPGRVLKGKRMPGHHGAERTKVMHLDVVEVDVERNLLLVKGSVPGPNGGYVYIEESLS